MSLFSIWPNFGFAENPYSNNTLPADEVGDHLLVGRDREVDELMRRIGSDGIHPSIEGPTGVGKTSLFNVSGYRMLRRCVHEHAGTLFVPCGSAFQMTDSIDLFEERVYYEVAQSLLRHPRAFVESGLDLPNLDAINRWLNLADHRQLSLGGTIMGFGAERSTGTVPNESDGFAESGFKRIIQEELQRVFPTPAVGGVVCVLDNLEILQTSQQAREVLEQLRDRLFTIHGLRWVLCGSRGIVSRARSDRLSGVFDAPMRIGALPDDACIELIERRLRFYGSESCYPPIDPEGFDYIYQSVNRNLRDSLALAQSYSDWTYGEFVKGRLDLPTGSGKMEALKAWIEMRSDLAHQDCQGVQNRAWQFFDDLAGRGGTCRAGDWEQYGFGTQAHMSICVTALVETNLAVRATDPDNASRSLASLTSEGWLVHSHRARYELPDGFGESD